MRRPYTVSQDAGRAKRKCRSTNPSPFVGDASVRITQLIRQFAGYRSAFSTAGSLSRRRAHSNAKRLIDNCGVPFAARLFQAHCRRPPVIRNRSPAGGHWDAVNGTPICRTPPDYVSPRRRLSVCPALRSPVDV
ncbi:hypothetical protein EVAR_49348_1 [Eumeta japonica]|uniref:Uncharacterized protein n=1 Tax=Eumeta variegata TaxID=151549 RepID=A0A4C1XXR5_EUMVA|nr:hypothetical protein EVAR_49348_1 [Eumeta japonica]